MERSKQKRAVAITSIWSYQELQRTGQNIAENKKVLATLLDNPPLTSRKISELTGIERTNITRVLYDLQNLSLVEVAHVAPCRTTGKKVRHYRISHDLRG